MPERRRRPSPAEQYRRLWVAAQNPSLDEFLAGLPDLLPADLLDVLETDRAERWRRGDRVKAEKYLRKYPAIRDDKEAALVIIYGEYYLRKELGEGPSLMEYIARFPAHARRLRDQVMWHEAIELGSSSHPQGPPEIPELTVGELLGRGGMCSVFHAADEQTGEMVAVKVLDREHLHHPVRVARFRREVESLMRLNHPNIVRAFRTGDDGGIPFLIMEFCAGGTLAKHLAGQPLPVADVIVILISLASAVQYAHDAGVIHRDLKPSNILLASNPASLLPKVADFGLAKCESDIGGSITATKETLGTPCYMAPELTTGARDADERTDVYGLGAILYELLTGRPPFVATTPLDVVRMVREEAPVPPSILNARVPAELDAICLKCLKKEPEARFTSAREVGEAIRAIQANEIVLDPSNTTTHRGLLR